LLRRAYGELSTADAEQLYAADLVIDLTRGKVSRGEGSINLTPTEFRLLVYLARHPGQALSRAQMLATVWEDDTGVESERTVNVYVRRLREKVELDPSQPTLILTVPGIGYRLVG
jgi:DNA-binding response OmpR family regulator